jgi:O-antigen ligase
MKKINSYLDKISLFLILALPIGLLISSGVSETIKVFIIIIFLINCFHKKNFSWLKSEYFILLFLIWISLLLNLLFSQNFNLSFSRNIFFFKNIIFVFALIYFLKKEKDFNLIFNIYLIITAIVAFDIFIEFFYKKNIFGFQSTDPSRIASFLGKELKIAHFMLGFLFIVSSYFLEKILKKSTNYKMFGFIIIIIFFISLLLTGERANSIRAVFIALIFVILTRKEIFTYKKIFLATIILLSFGTYFFSEKTRNRFDAILDPIKNIGAIEAFKETQHAAHYYTAIKIFEKYPIFGIGNKNFREECLKDEYKNNDYKRTAERCGTHPHQIYLELLSEHGLIGFFAITSVIFIILFKSFKIYLKNNNMIHLASILFIFSQFLPLIPSGSFFTAWGSTIFWLNFALLIFYNSKKYSK